jgi:hypothetical protein
LVRNRFIGPYCTAERRPARGLDSELLNRIAEFGQDGTLWVEHPVHTQVVYYLEHVEPLVKQKPELKNRQSFKFQFSTYQGALPQPANRMPQLCPPIWHRQAGSGRVGVALLNNFRTAIFRGGAGAASKPGHAHRGHRFFCWLTSVM